VYFYLTMIKSSEVVPQFSRKPPKLRQELAQHNIGPSKLVEDVCPMTNNHNILTIVMSTCSPSCQCVCCSSEPAKLNNLDNEYDELKEIVAMTKTPILHRHLLVTILESVCERL